MSKVLRFPPRLRAVGPNDIDHVAVWGAVTKDWRPIFGADYILGDGSRVSMSWRDTADEIIADARELAADGPYPIREGEP